ncbi:MAG: DUF881 domain-containing protein [Nocardioidaceae bacterium]
MTEPTSHREQPGAAPRWRVRIGEALRHRHSERGRRPALWRLLTPAVFVLAGVLFVTSAVSSEGTDLRPSRYQDLADLADKRSDSLAELNAELARLREQVDELTAGVQSQELTQAQAKLHQARIAAGVEAVTGPGLQVTLDDAPATMLDDDEDDVSLKLVHQQDIQAVVNALWAGGAEAITLQGQRITSTSGIKCVGNSVLLQGVAYPPPYVIAAIGDHDRLQASLDTDPAVQLYAQDAERYDMGYDVTVEDKLEFSAYNGSLDTRYAQVLPTPNPKDL